MKLRHYQKECAKSAVKWIEQGKGNPIIAAPTGSGKSLILCEVINRYLTKHPTKNVLVVSHVKEILDQNFNALWQYFGGEVISLFSAGLQEKRISKITVGGIQSIHKKAELFDGLAGLVIVDECHMINHRNFGMYRKLLDGIHAPVIGLTATPYRAAHGYIHIGDEKIFDGICSDWITGKRFNQLIKEGYLSPIISQQTDTDMDSSDIRIQAGEFNQKQLSQKFDKESITRAAVGEMVRRGEKRKKWLTFAIDIQHAEHIVDMLKEHKIKSLAVHSRMADADRNTAIAKFRKGKIRCLVGVNVPTTGFDVPDIDLISMLCPIQSVVKYIQSAGRGLRPAKGKTNCLLLDFGDNVERLGPINNPVIVQAGKRTKKGEQIMKTCPDCKALWSPAKKVCDACGHEFVFEVKITPKSSDAPALAAFGDEAIVIKRRGINTVTGGIAWLPITNVLYYFHQSPHTGRRCIKAVYSSINYQGKVLEYIHPYAPGFLGRQAMRYISRRTDGKLASNIHQNIRDLQNGEKPSHIKVDFTGKYAQILDYKFQQKRNPIYGVQTSIFTYEVDNANTGSNHRHGKNN